ncbi:putative beta-lysine N-acetyltransferase [Bacillus spongiae]|uniref:putative beta-lysine N-acetyltransferase n=1 Tax=Bacillus spongiae TaxID=2683610 RepID=UPI003AF45B14
MKASVEVFQEPTFYAQLYCDPYNRRIRIDQYRGDLTELHRVVCEKATQLSAEKIIIKVRQEHIKTFLTLGYSIEGVIDGYYRGSDAWMLSLFLHDSRRNSLYHRQEDEVIEKIQHLPYVGNGSSANTLKKAGYEDAKGLAELYRETFKIYPVPLHEEEYIKQSMDEGTIFYFFEEEGKIISAASAEINKEEKNAELTDCATDPAYRKGGLMKQLLAQLEADLKREGIFCYYSLARALSFGMNAAFKQLNYSYRGRLLNNCYIYDKMEDMNIWVKTIN